MDNESLQQIMELGFDKNQATIALIKNVNSLLIFRNQVLLKPLNGYSTVEEMFLPLVIC